MKYRFLRERGLPVPKPKKKPVLPLVGFDDISALKRSVTTAKKKRPAIYWNGIRVPSRFATLEAFLSATSKRWDRAINVMRITATFEAAEDVQDKRPVFKPAKRANTPAP